MQNGHQKTLGVSQSNLLNKIQIYLRWKRGCEGVVQPETEDFINKFNKGYCSGITVLWLYARWLETKNTPQPRDDYTWFKSVTELIAQLHIDDQTKRMSKNGNNLTDGEIGNISRFVQNIHYFQKAEYYKAGTQHGNLSTLIEDTIDIPSVTKETVKEYKISAVVTQEMLANLIEQIVRDDRMIYISCNVIKSGEQEVWHAVGLYKKNNIFYFFDSNNQQGEKCFSSAEDIAKSIFKDTQGDKFIKPDLLPISFMVYSRSAAIEQYEPPTKVLSNLYIQIPYDNDTISIFGIKAALRHPDLESLSFFLQHGDEKYKKIYYLCTCYVAIFLKFANIVELLLNDNNFDPNSFFEKNAAPTSNFMFPHYIYMHYLQNKWYEQTPLILAITLHNVDIVKILLSSPKVNPDIKNNAGKTALEIAIENKLIDIIQAFITLGKIDREKFIDLYKKQSDDVQKTLEDAEFSWPKEQSPPPQQRFCAIS